MTIRTSYSTIQPTEDEVAECLERLQILSAKYSDLGIDADLAYLIKADAFGLCLSLSRRKSEEDNGD